MDWDWENSNQMLIQSFSTHIDIHRYMDEYFLFGFLTRGLCLNAFFFICLFYLLDFDSLVYKQNNCNFF